MLQLEEASKSYAGPGEIVRAVKDVSLAVAPGEFLAIFGPSGSGKSSLLLLAAGLLRADAGTVRFQGRDLAQLSKRDMLAYRRRDLGFVFQEYNLAAGLTAVENVAIPLLMRHTDHHEARELARSALDDVGLSHRVTHTPERLSGGEKQRVAIARALVGNPKLILADEPTGTLDTETGDSVLELLSTLPRERGAAAIVVTHDARVARYSDRVLMMRDGTLGELDPARLPVVEP